MSVDVVEFASGELSSNKKVYSWNKASKNGLNWSLDIFTDFENSLTSEEHVYLKWGFDLDELEKQGVIGFTGTLTTNVIISSCWKPIKHDVVLTLEKKIVEIKVDTIAKCKYSDSVAKFKFELNLKPIRSTADDVPEEIVVNPIFAASELTDIALNVEGNKVHVSKQYLAFHSDYFRTLFFSDFKEKSMDEIPIVDVKYKDFELLLTTIYPNAPFPNDENCEVLLQLADRFLMSGVTHLVEHHLLHFSNIRLTKLVYFADKYQMDKLLSKCIGMILSDSREKCTDRVKAVKAANFYDELSDETKVKILETSYSY